MEHFLINSSICLLVLWLFYKFVLENTSWHQFKRFYLLFSIGISLIIPYIVVNTIIVTTENNTAFNLMDLNTIDNALKESTSGFQWRHVLWTIYLVGVSLMLFRFIKNLIAFKINEEDEVCSYSSYQLILRPEKIAPHSFLNLIIVSKDDHEQNYIPKAVLEHEKAHLDQKHSLDILLIETLIILFWFNPLFYLFRYSIKLNHEFLADYSVIQQGVNTNTYQELILRYATRNYKQNMANTFHFPIIKKRYTIMKTKTSKTSGLLRSLAIIPIITLLIIGCGEEETILEIENKKNELKEELRPTDENDENRTIMVKKNQTMGKILIDKQDYFFKKIKEEYKFFNKNGNQVDLIAKGYTVMEVVDILENISSEDIEEYNRLAKKHKAYMNEHNILIAWKEKTARMQLIFNSMSKDQRTQNEPWPYTGEHNGKNYLPGQIPPPPPPPPAPQKLSEIKINEQQFLDWREDNHRDDAKPAPLDFIDYYGDEMVYLIDGIFQNAENAKTMILKNDAEVSLILQTSKAKKLLSFPLFEFDKN